MRTIESKYFDSPKILVVEKIKDDLFVCYPEFQPGQSIAGRTRQEAIGSFILKQGLEYKIIDK